MKIDNYIEDIPLEQPPEAEAPEEAPISEEPAEIPASDPEQPGQAPAEAPEEISDASESEVPSDPPTGEPEVISGLPEKMPELVLDEDWLRHTASQRKPIRPELIMGIIALLAAVLLIFVIVLCQPYFKAEQEDPEALLDRHQAVTETAESTPETVESSPEAAESIPEAMGEDPEAVTVPETKAEEETGETSEPTIPPESNPYGRLDFQYKRHNYLYCLRTDSYVGIDVSAFQGDINWKKVKNSGVEFAMIRLGYRGYGKAGRLVEDDYAQKNLYEANKEGLAIGAYFFSQALNFQEVEDEIQFMLEILGDYTLDMPIVLDWEIPTAEARTAKMDARTLTDIQIYFCERMQELGYKPMVYFNWYQSEHLYYLNELEEYPFWLALYQDRMTYPWKVEMWQYTCTGKVPGIVGDVDINVYIPN